MTCDEARELLLEAEPGELEGTGGSPLSLHLAACGRCAAAAARIVQATRALDAHLAAPPDEEAVDAVLAALGRAGPRPVASVVDLRAPRWRRAAWGSLAMAAAATGLLFVARLPAPINEGANEAAPSVAAAVPPPPLIEASSAATVAVIETDNPDITVLWFF